MFKAPIKVLHPLLTATQEGNFKGTEGFGAIPFDGIVLAHSNESEWKTFRNNKNNEAFLDRIYIVKVPYCLRVSEEIKIYEKLLRNSSLADAKCAPGTLKMMSQFAMLTRLKEPENSSLYSKMQIYDGDNLKDTDPRAKSYQEYRDYAGVDEGMSGVSTRFAFKILSKVFNFDTGRSRRQSGAPDVRARAADRARAVPVRDRAEVPRLHQGASGAALRRVHRQGNPDRLPRELLASTARTSSTATSPTPTTGSRTRSTATPTPARCSTAARSTPSWRRSRSPPASRNPKDFRNEIVNFVLRARANNTRQEPALDQLREAAHGDREEDVLEHRRAPAGDQLQRQGSADEAKKHEDFVNRMVEKGYTAKQVRLLCEWYLRVRKSS